MFAHFRRHQNYELLPTTSLDAPKSSSSFEHHRNKSSCDLPTILEQPAWLPPSRWHVLNSRRRYITGRCSGVCRGLAAAWLRHRRTRRALRWIFYVLISVPQICFLLVFVAATFFPSYTNPPQQYVDLRQRCLLSNTTGRANVNNEKVFIAASIYDEYGSLAGGAWGDKIAGLVDLLGPDNVFVSIYENDPDPLSKTALEELGDRLACNSSLVAEHLPLEEIERVTIPSGEAAIKRISYLAEVRNRALRPLDGHLDVEFDKLLYVNDVVFDPVDVAQLLFSTNVDASGRTQYRAACAVDFINPFKFYDTFASRDLEGYSMGIPFYPWFTSSGNADSRNDVLAQKDAVRVRSCWGGVVAFEAKWFQSLNGAPHPPAVDSVAADTLPIRFRAETDIYWEASECCLINADIQKPRDPGKVPAETGIFVNPYVRVAYDEVTLSWLRLTRRPERLYSLIHNILNHAVGLPGYNPRRLEEPGDEVVEKVWTYENGSSVDGELLGSFVDVTRTAGPGRFCGGRKLLLFNEHQEDGESKWLHLPAPPEH